MDKKPEIIFFAGPNGSGKSTITKMANIIEPYINADEIKKSNLCSDIEAAQIAENCCYYNILHATPDYQSWYILQKHFTFSLYSKTSI